MKKLITILLLLFACLIHLCACGEGNETTQIIHAIPAQEPLTEEESVDINSQDEANSWDTFMSNDGRVEYSIRTDQPFSTSGFPIIEVTPHIFTAEEAQGVASLLFGDASFYDYIYDEPRTKNDLLESMPRWEQYMTDGTIANLFRHDTHIIEDYELVLGRFLESFDERLAAAPENVDHTPSQWSFQPESYYYGEIANENMQSIRVIADCGSLQYSCNVVNRSADDFTVHMLYAFLYNQYSPNNIDSLVQQYELCKSAYPTTAQLEIIEAKAQSVLDALDAGDWGIDVCRVDRLPRGAEDAYIVTVKAVPVFQGTAAIRFAQLTNMRSSAEGAQHYYYSDASFTFAPDGTLLDFSIYSPVDITDVNNDAETLTLDELLNAAKTILMQRGLDFYSRYYPTDHAFAAKVYIDQMTCGLVRIEVENGKIYRYVPALCLDGHIELYNENGNLIVDSSAEGTTRMLVLNALDGTNIVYSSENEFTGAEYSEYIQKGA